MTDYVLNDYDVTIYIDGERRKSFIISASSEKYAKIYAECILKEDTIITIENMDSDTYEDTFPYPRFRYYILIQIDENGERHQILDSREYFYLKKTAENISIPNTNKIEIIGIDEFPDNYKSYTTIFTREL